MLKKAIALLKPHEEYFAEDYYWNFRMGYSYYYLDQEGRALPYFRKALEKLPGDEDTQKLIDDCERAFLCHSSRSASGNGQRTGGKPLPRWKQSLRQMMDEDKDHTRGAELVAQMEGA